MIETTINVGCCGEQFSSHLGIYITVFAVISRAEYIKIWLRTAGETRIGNEAITFRMLIILEQSCWHKQELFLL